MEPTARVWRSFPWDPAAADGEPYSARYVPPLQGKGRFDLPGVPGGVLYLSETPEHAVAEMIQHFRGREIDAADLTIAGHPLSLVGLDLPTKLRKQIIDLCDPAVLVELRLRPDTIASRDRHVTQRIAADIASSGRPGLRWWSALGGDWHTVVLFHDRLDSLPQHDPPEPLTLQHPALREAASMLGIPLSPP